MQVYCAEIDDYIDDTNAMAVFDALVQVTGYDSFALDGLEAKFGDDYEHVITREMLEEAGHIANMQWWYVRDIMLDRCCEFKLDGSDNVFDASVEL